MSDDTDQSRSERLRERRSQRSDRTTTDDTDTASPADTSETVETTTAEPGDTATIKDEQVGTYMYIPESQKRELQRCYNVLKAEYEYEYDTSFEKNRHFYPLLIQYGLENLDGLDATEIQTRLDSL